MRTPKPIDRPIHNALGFAGFLGDPEAEIRAHLPPATAKRLGEAEAGA